MKAHSKLLALALLATLASPLLAAEPTATKQHTAVPHDHTPRVHDRSVHISR
jgi:hypothetical protein